MTSDDCSDVMLY